MSAGAALLVLLLQQGSAGSPWLAASSAGRATVGDTIWIERVVPTPPGWRVRAGRLPQGQAVEPLGDAAVSSVSGGWRVRYPAVAWTPGVLTVTMPPLWRLGPDGSADSLAGGAATVRVASVIPDSVVRPAPQPPLAPLRVRRRTALPTLAAVLLSAGMLVGLVAWRRRAPRRPGPVFDLLLDAEVPDARWLAAGEPKAVAARAVQRLRRAIARAVPDAHEALSTPECLAAVERARPAAPVREVRELLTALDQVAFATAHGVEVAPLARRAAALAEDLAR